MVARLIVHHTAGQMSVLAEPTTTAFEVCTNIGSRLAVMGKMGRGHLHEWEDADKRVVGRRLSDDECVVPMVDYVFVSEQPADA